MAAGSSPQHITCTLHRAVTQYCPVTHYPMEMQAHYLPLWLAWFLKQVLKYFSRHYMCLCCSSEAWGYHCALQHSTSTASHEPHVRSWITQHSCATCVHCPAAGPPLHWAVPTHSPAHSSSFLLHGFTCTAPGVPFPKRITKRREKWGGTLLF